MLSLVYTVPPAPRPGEPGIAAPTAGAQTHSQDACVAQLRPAVLGRPQCGVVPVGEGVGDRPVVEFPQVGGLHHLYIRQAA